jgi:N-acetylglucosaminyl-diphospho-decaprenol L-rhamnosyltransferase
VTEAPDCGPPATVAVVSWNTRALLSECLASLQRDAQDGIAEVWVHDNASSDGSPALVRERFAWVRLIASSQNVGFGAAVNAIAARTSTPWLALANADVRLEPGALRTLLAEGERHPEAAAIAPRLILPDGRNQRSVYPFPTIPFAIAYVTGLTGVSRRLAWRWCIGGGFDPEREREVPWAVGAFLLVRRVAWEQVGGFDPRQWMYAEDLDLGWRLGRAGWRIRYVPRARIIHAESAATALAWGGERHARWHASTYAWLARRRGVVYARLTAAIYVAGSLFRAAVLAPLVRSGGAAVRSRRQEALNTARAHSVGLRARRRQVVIR